LSQQTGTPAAPRSPQEALQQLENVVVPKETFLAWLNALAPIPSGYAAGLYVSMTEHLAATTRATVIP
jgi:hypothetical protein